MWSRTQYLETLSQQAASEGAGLITWAEAFAYLGRHDGKKEILEPLPEGGPILQRCRIWPEPSAATCCWAVFMRQCQMIQTAAITPAYT